MILTIYFKYMESLSQNSYLYMIAHMIAWSDEVANCHRVWNCSAKLNWPGLFFSNQGLRLTGTYLI